MISYVEPPKKYGMSYILAVFAAIFFGSGNFIAEDLSSRLGYPIIFAQSFGLLITSLIYYTFRYVKWRQVKANKEASFFSEVSAAYYEEFTEQFDVEDGFEVPSAARKFRAFSWYKVSCMMSRALSNLII